MKRKRSGYRLSLLIIAFAIPAGCKNAQDGIGRDEEGREPDATARPESTVTGELKEAGKHLKEAGKTAGKKATTTGKRFGNLLTEKWDEARDGSFEMRKSLTEAYQRNLGDAKERLNVWKEGARERSKVVLDDLATKIAKARPKLKELEEASAENWDATRRAFNVAWHELRNAVKKAGAEFEKRPGKG